MASGMTVGQPTRIPNILSIAGTDPSGGAGIQADLKTFAALGVYGMAVVTAIVAQNTSMVGRIQVLSAGLVRAQCDAVFADVRVDAVKLGMLGSAAIVRAVAERLRLHPGLPVVLDPVMVSSTGRRLLAPEAVATVREVLLPLTTVLTPNLAEAGVLLAEQACTDRDWMAAAAQRLRHCGPAWVLLKGGHRDGVDSADVLAGPEGVEWLEGSRIDTRHGHGTGCTLSAALAAGISQGTVIEAAWQAKQFVASALRHAVDLQVGHGVGPLHHGFKQTRSM